ncbi:MAG TPA: hypothetical protein VMZ53_33965 [Kofleriaceae bacterium]|nr:hypothetical protein [Kofleriaceae bacterium]
MKVALLIALGLVAIAARAASAGDAMQCTASGCRPVSSHKTGDITIEAGAGIAKTWLDLREDSASPLMAEVAGGMGVFATPVVAIGLRGHVTLGRGPTTITSLGVDVKLDRGGLFFAASPAIASVTAPETDALAAALELRAGLDLGSVQIALAVTPMYAFANDGLDATAQLGAALRVGANVAIVLP